MPPSTEARRQRGPLPVSHVGLVERTRRCIEVLFEEEVPIFASGLGSPAFLVERAHRQGMKR